MRIIKQILKIYTSKRSISHSTFLLLFLLIFWVPTLAQEQKNILTTAVGISYGANNSYAIDHDFDRSLSYYLSGHYRFFPFNETTTYIGIEPIYRYSKAGFEKAYPDQVHLANDEYIDLYTENLSAQASFSNLLLMVNGGYYHEGGSFDMGMGLGYAWYDIDKHVENLRTEYLYQNSYLLNDDDIVDYFNQSTLLNSLKSEAVFAFQIGFRLPLSKLIGLESNRLSLGFRFLAVYGLKYTKEYIPEGLHTYYSNVGPEKTADMGSGNGIISINYKI